MRSDGRSELEIRPPGLLLGIPRRPQSPSLSRCYWDRYNTVGQLEWNGGGQLPEPRTPSSNAGSGRGDNPGFAARIGARGDSKDSLNDFSALEPMVIFRKVHYDGYWLSRDRRAELVNLRNAQRLIGLCDEYVSQGPQAECNNIQVSRRPRGLDMLYREDISQQQGTGTTQSSRRMSSAASSRSWRLTQGFSEADDQRKALELLKKVPMFRELDETSPGLGHHLVKSKGTWFTAEKKGQVIFRQDDPPTYFYIISTGRVGLFLRQKTYDATPRDSAEEEPNLTLTQAIEQGVLPPNGVIKRTKGVPPPSFRTIEDHSIFSEASKLGKHRSELGDLDIFGEQGLAQQVPRRESIKCLEDTELLIVDPEIFRRTKADLRQRADFFDQHLPGFQKARTVGADEGPHPSTFFETVQLRKGATILDEGIFAPHAAIYIICKGTVELRRFPIASANPAYVLAKKPLTKSSWSKSCAPPKVGVAECDHQTLEEFRCGPARRGSGLLTVERLDVGASFCSLGALPIGAPEPFTVVVSSDECVLYQLVGAAMTKLPPKVLLETRMYIARSLHRRLCDLAMSTNQFGTTGSLPSLHK